MEEDEEFIVEQRERQREREDEEAEVSAKMIEGLRGKTIQEVLAKKSKLMAVAGLKSKSGISSATLGLAKVASE